MILLQEWLKTLKENARIKRVQNIEAEAYERVQLKEYAGKVYIAINNIAYIPVEDIKGNACELIIKARQTYIEQCGRE